MPDNPTPPDAADRVIARRLGQLSAEHAAMTSTLDKIHECTSRSADALGNMDRRGARAEQRALATSIAWHETLRRDWKWIVLFLLGALYIVAPNLRDPIDDVASWALPASPAAPVAHVEPGEPVEINAVPPDTFPDG